MFGSIVLEVAIGMVFTYLAFSLLCSGICEFYSSLLERRSRFLQSALQLLFNGDDPRGAEFLAGFLAHPLVKGISPPRASTRSAIPAPGAAVDPAKAAPRPPAKPILPQYIAPDRFVDVVLMQLARAAVAGAPAGADATALPPVLVTLKTIREGVQTLPPSEIKTVLESLMDEAGDDLDRVRRNLLDWYNDSMERVSGWYKAHTQFILFLVALTVTCAMNLDSWMLASAYYRDPALRQALVAAAGDRVREGAEASDRAGDLEAIQAQLRTLRLPFGWAVEADGQPAEDDPRRFPTDAVDIVGKLLGLLVTTLALTMGAPFWFDVLNKLVNVRVARQPPPPGRDEAKADPGPSTA